MFRGSTQASMWCLRGYYFKMAPGTVKKAIAAELLTIYKEHGPPRILQHDQG